MFKNLYFKSWLLLLCMIVGVGSAWAEDSWVKTDATALQTGDVVVIVSDNGSPYAMSNNNGTSTAPTATAVTVENNIITSEVPTTIQWSVTVSNSSFTFTSDDNTLYCTNTNNGVRVGGSSSSTGFEIKDYYLYNSGTGRYLGVYNSQDWRCYTTINNNIKNQTLSFYKKIAAEKTDPTITFNNGSVRVGKTLDLGTLFESNSEGEVTYSITEGNSYASIEGSTLTGVAEGEVKVKAEQASYSGYNAGEATATITVNAALTLSSISITTPPTKTIYTEGETFDATGMVVTATYSDSSTDDVTASCIFSPSTALATSDAEITVSYTENGVTKTATQTIVVNELPKYTVTFADGGSVTEETAGAGVDLPSRAKVGDYSFAGWSETEVSTETTTAPTIFPVGSYIPTANITLYPVYTRTEDGGVSENEANVTIADYASANNWSNGSAYLPLKMDENVSVGGDVSGNNFKYYTSDTSWRFYNGGSFTVSTVSGTLTSVTLTFASGGALSYNSTNVTSGTAVSVSGQSATFSASATTKITKIDVKYSVSSSTTYYWSSPVAAAVEKPVITLVANPFQFSTTATITCETDGASIYYRYSEEDDWTEYTTALTITATTTIYAKAVKGEDESTVAQVTATKNLAEPTVTVSGDLTLDLDGETSVSAGTLTAAVTYEDDAVEGATVTWISSDESKATIDEETGVVTILATGSVTFTATYAGNDDYAEATGTKTVTVINSKAPGSESKPYTVAEAIDAIDNNGNVTGVYATGIVSEIVTAYSSQYGNISYNISADGSTNGQQLQAYRGKSYNGENFTSEDDIQVGDVVVVYGNLQKYGSTYEFGQNNQLVSLQRVEKPATPTFSVEEGTYTEDQSVEIACATDGATIYYTIDGTTPTAQGNEYTAAISISETTTIKAIAVKDDVASDVASVTYTINKEPFITLSTTSVAASAEGADGTITVTYNNITEVVAEVKFYEADGETEATYDWLAAEINNDNNVEYVIDENTSSEARTAYLKVYALNDEANDVYSDIITITQAGFVVDYATLPFEWEGGASTDLKALTGIMTNGLGSDYAAGNAPYLVKLDGTGDYIQVKTDKRPVVAALNVKMIGGANSSTITVQESADGENFTDVEELTISGSQNTVLFLNTTKSFATDTRFVRFYFTKGSNVGVGAITIDDAYETATIGNAGYATYVAKYNVSFPAEVTAYIVDEIKTSYVNLTKVTAVPAGTPVVLNGEANTYTLTPASSTDAVSGNLLKVSDGTVNGDGSTIYALANKTNGVGFYRVAANLTVPAGKPYLEIPAAESGAREFIGFAGGTTTGISTVATERTADFYNLNGQRVETLKKGGLYIQGGKKVIVK